MTIGALVQLAAQGQSHLAPESLCLFGGLLLQWHSVQETGFCAGGQGDSECTERKQGSCQRCFGPADLDRRDK